MTPVVWANIALVIPFLVAFIGIPLWMTFRFSQAGPDHSDARSYLRYKAALATMPARSQHEQRTAA